MENSQKHHHHHSTSASASVSTDGSRKQQRSGMHYQRPCQLYSHGYKCRRYDTPPGFFFFFGSENGMENIHSNSFITYKWCFSPLYSPWNRYFYRRSLNPRLSEILKKKTTHTPRIHQHTNIKREENKLEELNDFLLSDLFGGFIKTLFMGIKIIAMTIING